MKASRVLALIVVLVVLPVTAWAQQQTVRACVKNANGQVRIVGAAETCLPSEHLVTWPSGAAPTVPGPTTPPDTPPVTPPAPGALRVLDQKDVLVGMFAAPNVVARQVGDLWVGISASSVGFQVTDYYYMYYLSGSCSGDAYMPLDAMSMLRTAVVLQGSSGQVTAAYPGKPEVANTTIVSFGVMSGGAFTCLGAYQPTPWVPTFGKAATLDLSTHVLPFKIVQ